MSEPKPPQLHAASLAHARLPGAHEREAKQLTRAELARRIAEYEAESGMASDTFELMWRAGELPERQPYTEWAKLLSIRQALKRLTSNRQWVQHRNPDGHGLGHTIRRNCDAECAKFVDTTFHREPPPLSWETE